MKTKQELSLIFTTLCVPCKKGSPIEFAEYCNNQIDLVRTASALFPEYVKEITRFASAYTGFMSAKVGVNAPNVDSTKHNFKEFNRFSSLGEFIYNHFEDSDFIFRLYLMCKDFINEYPELYPAYFTTAHVLIECKLNEVEI